MASCISTYISNAAEYYILIQHPPSTNLKLPMDFLVEKRVCCITVLQVIQTSEFYCTIK